LRYWSRLKIGYGSRPVLISILLVLAFSSSGCFRSLLVDHSVSPSLSTAFQVSTSSSAGPGFSYSRQWGSLGGLSSPNGVAIDASGNLYVADSQNYGVGKIARNGTLVSMWGNHGAGPGQFEQPVAVAVDSIGNVFATDYVTNTIQEFSTTGVFIRSWNSNGTANGMFSHPQGIAINTTNYLYMVDSGNQRVGIFRNDGVFVKYFRLGPPGNFTMPMGIALDSQGSVYVDDANTDNKDGFSGNVTKFTKNGGFVTSWGGVNSGGTLFSPTGLAVDGSFNVYVADDLAKNIQKFNINFAVVWTAGSYGTIPGHFSQPLGAAVDNLGNVFVSDPVNFNVQQFSSATGSYITSLSYPRLGLLSTPLGSALDNSGNNIYVTDHDNNRIQKFSTGSGVLITSWGGFGNLTGQFNGPSNVGVDGNGNVYVTDYGNNRVQKFSSTGAFITAWSKGINNTPFCGVSGIALDAGGNVYVTDFNNDGVVGCSRVQKFDSNGNFLTSWGTNGSGNGQFYNPRGIIVDRMSGLVYVSDSGNHRVEKFSGTGQFLFSWGSLGSQNGQFNLPMGIGLDSGGDVYVADTLNNRVQEFLGNGTFVTSFGTLGSGSGQLANPSGVVVDSSDNVYVTDNNQYSPALSNSRVEVFQPFHDTAATRLVLSRFTAYQDVILVQPVMANVTVADFGLSNETFLVSLVANSTIVAQQNVFLTTGLSQLIRFSWFPNITIRANYNVTVQAQQVLGDPNVANNIIAGGLFNVRMKGDVNGDCRVDIIDLSTIGAKFGLVSTDRSYVSAPDLNNDGTINIIDLVLTAVNFGRSC